jgi:hypothetical protein
VRPSNSDADHQAADGEHTVIGAEDGGTQPAASVGSMIFRMKPHSFLLASWLPAISP